MSDIIFLIFYAAFSLLSSSPSGDDSMPLNYFEYNRGISSEVIAKLGVYYPGYYNYTFHDVIMTDLSLFPDQTIFADAFFEQLFTGDIVNMIKAFTEPYYGIRFYHFRRNLPNFGWGVEFIHFKVFLPSGTQQTVHITGTDADGNDVDFWAPITDYITHVNISHGVNHLSFSLVYRLMLFQTEKIPQGIFQPYVSGSFGICIPHPELYLADIGKVAYSYQLGFPNFGGGLNLGFRIQPFRNFAFYMEYKFTFTYLLDMHFDNGADGKFTASFITNHLVWGMSLNF